MLKAHIRWDHPFRRTGCNLGCEISTIAKKPPGPIAIFTIAVGTSFDATLTSDTPRSSYEISARRL